MNYIDNERLLEEINIYKKTKVKTEELGRMLLLIAKKYTEKGNFSGYSWKDDMIGDAVFTCLRYMHNFDVNVENPNPFGYFSMIIYRSFLNYIAKQKIHSKIKDICYKYVDFIAPDIYLGENEDEKKYFDINSINYKSIRGNKKKKKRNKRKN